MLFIPKNRSYIPKESATNPLKNYKLFPKPIVIPYPLVGAEPD